MTQEYKELLLKDLCARLQYGVKFPTKVYFSPTEDFIDKVYTIRTINSDGTCRVDEDNGKTEFSIIWSVKPYLFPLSSMTKEQKEDLLLTVVGKEGLKLFSVTKDGIVSNDKEEQSLNNFCFNIINFSNETTEAYIDWLNKNHFDYRGLIEKGLAIDATGLNIY